MLKLAILVSGRGSNLQAIIDAIEKKGLPAKIEIVISNLDNAFALERAQKHKLNTFVSANEGEILHKIHEKKVDLICLAGYMRILSPEFVKKYKNKIINIHPALLPAFPGLHVQKKALEYGVKFSGCTVHFVDEGCDTGPIILQAVVPVMDNDTEETLSARILEQEHKIYPQAIKLIAEKKIKIVGRKVLLS